MKRKLEKLKMPPRKDKLDLSSLADMGEEGEDQKSAPGADDQYGDEQPGAEDADMPDEGSPEEEASESPAEEQMEDDGKHSPEEGPLAHVDDEELMAEIKKRGLLDQLEHGGSEDSSAGDSQDDDGSSKY